MEEESKVKDGASKEEKTRIYKILLLTYARRLSKYQDQIKNIYFHNNIISSIKDETHDYLLNEHVTSQHYFIDTLIKSNENQEFLKSIQLIQNQNDKGGNKINKEQKQDTGNGNRNSNMNSSSNDGGNSSNSNNNAENDTAAEVSNDTPGVNQVNQRTQFNNYIMDIMERFHLFMLLKILFVLFLFEANSKMYFIVSGLFILYNRGFFDFLISNFNFISSNDSIEQVLRRMSESRNMNNMIANENNVQISNMSEGGPVNNQQEEENMEENDNQHLIYALEFIHKEGKNTSEEDIEEKEDDDNINKKTNEQNILSTSTSNSRDFINENKDDEVDSFHAAWYEDDITEDKEFVREIYDGYNYELNDENLQETHGSDHNSSVKYMKKKNKKSLFFLKKKKIEQKTHATELDIKNDSCAEFNSSTNMNEKGDSNYIDHSTDNIFREMNDSKNVDLGNFLGSRIRRRKINNISSNPNEGGNKDDSNDDKINVQNDNGSEKNAFSNNKIYYHKNSKTVSNVLNNSMNEFVNSDCNDSENSIDSEQSSSGTSSSMKKKKKKKKIHIAQNTGGEEDRNTDINVRRKPTKLEKYIYQSVVMFFMTLLPWWVPDIAYLED
ncbi:hypothetical protein, conserved [Plasmodium gonderi]|uniref:Uncharacterized protein n=1 Tax=Plasmodium gonderi TaxID=77519 RepID=A0A1Y1JLT8_PLAGO|nr:hypothetical protein, conserved [Plasmodium gonderi]GAW83536.1 hypothetical protein, conserved [Plasmodium gonderi]